MKIFSKKSKQQILLLLIIFFVCIISSNPIVAQDTIGIDKGRAECGDIFEAEFGSNFETHTYVVQMQAGGIIRVSGATLGNTLAYRITVTDPAENRVGFSDAENDGDANVRIVSNTPSMETAVLSANGDYNIIASNYNVASNARRASGGIGVYTIYIGCTLPDGTVIEPGQTQSTNVSPPQVALNSTTTTFSGTGFPGLPSVDFSDVAELPLPVGLAMGGAVTPTGGEIIGYLVDGSAGDTLDLSFTRVSGNLNLGLVVLYGDNTVVFQASLITSQTLSTRFTVPETGTYTIGIFRIDLLPPDAPEATAFQIMAALNP